MFQILSAVVLAALCHASFAQSQDQLNYNAVTGNYELTYCCDDFGRVNVSILEPATKIEPAISSYFSKATTGIKYDYEIALSQASRRDLRLFFLDGVLPPAGVPSRPGLGASEADLRAFQQASTGGAPQGWVLKSRRSTPSGGFAVGWSRPEYLIARYGVFGPGAKQSGFNVNSEALPGVVIAQFQGEHAIWEFVDEGPAEGSPVQASLDTLRRNSYVPRFAAGPLIVTALTPASDTLAKLRLHVDQIFNWALFDAQTTTTIKRYLDDAISHLTRNEQQAAIASLGQLRTELRKTFPTLDVAGSSRSIPPTPIPTNPVDAIAILVTPYDRLLAARVVDFDVEYIQQGLVAGQRAVVGTTEDALDVPSCLGVKFTDWVPRSTPPVSKCTITIEEETGQDAGRWATVTGLDPVSSGESSNGQPTRMYLKLCDDVGHCVMSNAQGSLWAEFSRESVANAPAEFEDYDATFKVYLCGNLECSISPEAGKLRGGVAFFNVYLPSFTGGTNPNSKVQSQQAGSASSSTGLP